MSKFSRNLAIAAGATALAAAMAFAPRPAQAADGTITINGKIISQTCSVTTGSGGNFTVTLPVVNISDLTTSGDVAGTTSFAINLENCPTTPSVQVASSFSGTNINANGRLTNTGSATNVVVQLLNGDSTVIDLSAGDATSQNSKYASISGSGTATLNYKAQYYATSGSVTAGTVQTQVKYTLVYK